jgi:hypothetical protein
MPVSDQTIKKSLGLYLLNQGFFFWINLLLNSMFKFFRRDFQQAFAARSPGMHNKWFLPHLFITSGG